MIPDDIRAAAKKIRARLCIDSECTFDNGCGCLDAIAEGLMELHVENERLRAIVEERFKDTRLVSAGGRGEGFGFDLMGGPIPYIAEYLAQFMGHRDEGGASNYSEIEIQHNELGALTLTMQRRSGKTPHQFRKEAEARAEAAEAALAALKPSE